MACDHPRMDRDALRELAGRRGFRRLLAVRLVSQCGDGVFQVGLATLFFFAPERLATASDVAAAFAVLLLPFTVVGPWAGVLLDRWRRRGVLLVGNAVRVVLTLAHLDHALADHSDGNLKAMCQACHLRYDREQHARTARATREKKWAGQDPLFGDEGTEDIERLMNEPPAGTQVLRGRRL